MYKVLTWLQPYNDIVVNRTSQILQCKIMQKWHQTNVYPHDDLFHELHTSYSISLKSYISEKIVVVNKLKHVSRTAAYAHTCTSPLFLPGQICRTLFQLKHESNVNTLCTDWYTSITWLFLGLHGNNIKLVISSTSPEDNINNLIPSNVCLDDSSCCTFRFLLYS